LFYVPENLTRQAGGEGGLVQALGRALDMDVRFASVARGVLDLRDLAFYAGVTASFLALNVLILRARAWSRGLRTRGQRLALVATIGLVVGNALAFNLWLAPLGRARVDLTE